MLDATYALMLPGAALLCLTLYTGYGWWKRPSPKDSGKVRFNEASLDIGCVYFFTSMLVVALFLVAMMNCITLVDHGEDAVWGAIGRMNSFPTRMEAFENRTEPLVDLLEQFLPLVPDAMAQLDAELLVTSDNATALNETARPVIAALQASVLSIYTLLVAPAAQTAKQVERDTFLNMTRGVVADTLAPLAPDLKDAHTYATNAVLAVCVVAFVVVLLTSVLACVLSRKWFGMVVLGSLVFVSCLVAVALPILHPEQLCTFAKEEVHALQRDNPVLADCIQGYTMFPELYNVNLTTIAPSYNPFIMNSTSDVGRVNTTIQQLLSTKLLSVLASDINADGLAVAAALSCSAETIDAFHDGMRVACEVEHNLLVCFSVLAALAFVALCLFQWDLWKSKHAGEYGSLLKPSSTTTPARRVLRA